MHGSTFERSEGGSAVRAMTLDATRAERERPHALHILTGEYPPAPGGVSDYTRLVARGLSTRGFEVHVWAPGDRRGPLVRDAGVAVHALPHAFGPRSLRQLSRTLSHDRGSARVLIQYVPHAFGYKAMNVAFASWAAMISRRHRVWLMMHELATPFARGQGLRRQGLAVVTHSMAALLLARADHVFVSTSAWIDQLTALLPRLDPPTWIPIPSNLPTATSPPRVQQVRAELLGLYQAKVVGHFGTYGEYVGGLLRSVFSSRSPDHERVHYQLLGRGALAFRAKHFPSRSDVTAHEDLAPDEAAARLAACDVVVQPFIDGVSTRRTTAMASLALGVPLVTNDGPLTESVWRGGAVALAPYPDAVAISKELDRVLALPEARSGLGRAGMALYRAHFSVERTLETLAAADA